MYIKNLYTLKYIYITLIHNLLNFYSFCLRNDYFCLLLANTSYLLLFYLLHMYDNYECYRVEENLTLCIALIINKFFFYRIDYASLKL